MLEETKFYTEQLKPLVGSKIDSVVHTPVDEFGDQFFGLGLLKPDGSKVILWILRDDEGNGPGSFEIQPVEED